VAKVVLIATGGVKAWRQLELADLLLAKGHEVRCLNTRKSLLFLALYFIRNPLKLIKFLRVQHNSFSELFIYIAEMGGRISHVKSSRWADVILVAPTTANSMGKIVSGITDSFPLLVIRAFELKKKVLVAPSMNPEMWSDPFTQRNAKEIRASDKYILIEPVLGKSNSGDIGYGIMAPNEQIIDAVEAVLADMSRPDVRPRQVV